MIAKIFLLAILCAGLPTANLQAQTPCVDLTGVDFGDCPTVLGVAFLGDGCYLVSGCDSPEPLYGTLEQCYAGCDLDPCADVSAIDFGPCEAILGWGRLGSECQLISGCTSPVPLFATQADCQACDTVAVEDETWARIKRLFR